MRRSGVFVAAAAALVGCRGCPGPASPAPPPDPLSPVALPTSARICPDPANCPQPNGDGVYTEEGGYAGMGSDNVMITHLTSAADLDGLRYDTDTNAWLTFSDGSTRFQYAQYKGGPLQTIESITEQGTVPTFTLADIRTHAQTLVTSDLSNLTVEVDVNLIDSWNATFVLAFSPGPTLPGRSEHSYYMTWRDATDPAMPAVPYCVDSKRVPDPIVFQQGISVDPLTGAVTRTPGDITVSCSKGAIATVFRWGYSYVPDAGRDDTFYFDAAINMKRDSYCADAHYFTRPGTIIEFADDQHIAIPSAQPGMPVGAASTSSVLPSYPEAMWSPTGATCLNPANERRATLAAGFTSCPGHPRLPPCPPSPTGRYLVDGPLMTPSP